MCYILKRGKLVKNIDKKWLAAGVLMMMVVCFFVKQLQPAPVEEPFLSVQLEQQTQFDEMPQPEIVVHVAGAVQKPGVYTLLEGQRVEDAINLAGLSETADVDALNRAAVLSDGQKIIVPTVGEAEATEMPAESALVDLNQADLQQLMTLPGIGQVKAQAILDYRAQQGLFKKIEDIQQVNGIGAATFAQIKNKIKI